MLSYKKNNNLAVKYQGKKKLRYASRKYSNPFFTKKRKNPAAYTLFWQTKIILAAFLIIATALIWFLFYSNFFTIKKISALGDEGIEPTLIEKAAWQQTKSNLFIMFPQKNIFFFNSGDFKKKLETRYSFSDLRVKKRIPNEIIIKYAEKKCSMIWLEDDKYFYADKEKGVISEINLLEIKSNEYPIISNLSDSKIKNNEITVEQSYIACAIGLFNAFKGHTEFNVEEFIIDQEINTVKAKLKDGPFIYFNIKKNLDKQFNKLIVIKNEKIKKDFNNKAYIDLRIGDSVYYR